MTILTTIWPGLIDFTHFRADGARARLVDEGAHDVEGHVRLKQRAAHFAHGDVDVLLGEGATPRQAVEYAGELFGKALEHEKILFAAADRVRGLRIPRIARRRIRSWPAPAGGQLS